MEATITTDINTAYTQMRELIAKQAATFKRKYGGEFEELLSTANEAFTKQHHAFFAGKTAIKDDYQAAIRMFIWDAMLERTRRSMRRMEKAAMIPIDGLENLIETRPRANWILEDLSKDAAYVVETVLDTPEVFGTRHITKEVVQRHLRTLGWQYKRIKAAFNEIKTVLQET